MTKFTDYVIFFGLLFVASFAAFFGMLLLANVIFYGGGCR